MLFLYRCAGLQGVSFQIDKCIEFIMVYMILLLDKLYSIDKLLSLLHISDTIFLRKKTITITKFFLVIGLKPTPLKDKRMFYSIVLTEGLCLQ